MIFINIPLSGCDHIAVKENNYAVPELFCGLDQEFHYHSVGRSLTISFLFSTSYNNPFTLEYASIANIRLIQGKVGDQGIIQSPYFPNPYPRDYSCEIRLQKVDYVGFIYLVFDDFQLTPWSFMEIYDANSTHVHALTSNTYRPPVILSKGNELTLRFHANGGRAPGYKLTYTFLNEPPNHIPSTDCGGLVENGGGVITMVNMSNPNSATLYDCVWLLKPQTNFHAKSHVAVHIAKLSNIGNETTIEIRQGLTSSSTLLELLNSSYPFAAEHVVPIDVGFYIRLRGYLSRDFQMAITYFSVSFTECYATNFLCSNHRCIDAHLRCDGFDHCGDNSDELSPCLKGISPQDPSWWFSHTPNYYFPKTTDFTEIGATSFVLLTATLGVVIFVISLVALLYRMSSHTRLMRERQARIDFIRSQLISSTPPPVERPPSYEAPPDYAIIDKLNKEMKLDIPCGGLRVLVPPTPVKYRRGTPDQLDMNSSLSSLETIRGRPSKHHSPARVNSRSSTPGRSRHSTPQRRVRKSNNVTPLHISHLPNTLEASEIIPNSPPPPYEESIDTVFHLHILQTVASESNILMEETNEEKNTVMGNPADNESDSNFKTTITECGCSGACNCPPCKDISNFVPSLNFLANKAKILQNYSQRSLPDFKMDQNRSLDIYFSQDELKVSSIEPAVVTSSISIPIFNLGARKDTKVLNRYFSFNQPKEPLALLKKSPLNRSM